METNRQRVFKTTAHKSDKWSHVLICFPWAGGGKTSFSSLSRAFKDREQLLLYTVAYSPNDSNTDRPASVSELVDLLYPELKLLLQTLLKEKHRLGHPKPSISFFGFSYGGLIAYEVLKRFESEYQQAPFRELVFTFRGLTALEVQGERIIIDQLIACAVASPVYLSEKNSYLTKGHHQESKQELTAHIIACGGLPAGIDPAFLQRALPMIQWDYRSFETYSLLPKYNSISDATTIATGYDLIDWEHSVSSAETTMSDISIDFQFMQEEPKLQRMTSSISSSSIDCDTILDSDGEEATLSYADLSTTYSTISRQRSDFDSGIKLLTRTTVIYSSADADYIPDAQSVRSWQDVCHPQNRVNLVDVNDTAPLHFSVMFEPAGAVYLQQILLQCLGIEH